MLFAGITIWFGNGLKPSVESLPYCGPIGNLGILGDRNISIVDSAGMKIPFFLAAPKFLQLSLRDKRRGKPTPKISQKAAP